MAGAYQLGLDGVLDLVLRRIKAFHDSVTNLPFFTREKICEEDRAGSDEFFKRDVSVQQEYTDQLLLTDGSIIAGQKKIHFISAMEQEHNLRYNCSRRHAIRTAGSNSNRLAQDLPAVYTYEVWPDA